MIFHKGDEVKLTYYDDEEQVSRGWIVKEYDNGLLTVGKYKGEGIMERYNKEEDSKNKEEPKRKKTKGVTAVFNLRSIGFLKAELQE